MVSKGCIVLIISFIALAVKIDGQGEVVIYNPDKTKRWSIRIRSKVEKLDDLCKIIKKKYPNRSNVRFGKLLSIRPKEYNKLKKRVEIFKKDKRFFKNVTKNIIRGEEKEDEPLFVEELEELKHLNEPVNITNTLYYVYLGPKLTQELTK
jgi:5-methylcytosine-specific restriction endonuclease McrBC GTP-binding regulatory subunit McrB